jgi:PAS domain S-box-containing protein
MPDYRAIFAATASPYAVLDPEFVIVDLNDAFLRGARRTREELLGRNVFDAFPENPDDPAADGANNLRRSLERVLRERVPDRMDVQKYDIVVDSGSGQHYAVHYWTAVNTPLLDAEGNLTHILHCTEEVTERIAADTALRESERRFRALVNATADVVYRMSPDWKQMRELDGRGFLKDTSAPGDYHMEDYVPLEEHARARDAIAEAIRTKSMFDMEHRVLRADRSIGWTHSRAVPILDAQGGIIEWIGAASDITDRKHVEEQLQDASRRKDEFLAMLAHELRNPLAPISAAAELLELGALGEARVRHTSQVIRRQVGHMTNLVNDLLDVSRVTQGLVALEKAQFDIREVVADAVEQVTPLIQARRQHLDLRLPDAAAIVTGDRKRLVQTVANLLNNAAKFTQDGGRLQVGAEVVGAYVRIDVVDDGIGMAPDTAAHAFELFSQAERSADRSAGGLGLGLALVKKLVELHGGTVACESAGIGRGSRFTIRLPFASADAPDAAHQEAAAAPGTEADGLRILVVDDNVDAATMLAMVLESMGHEVLVEHGSRQALERAATIAPQVCVLDIGLPDMDGNELAQRLRAQPGMSGAVLIAITGYGREEDRRRSHEAGFDHHLVKPVDIDRLGAILAGIGQAA